MRLGGIELVPVRMQTPQVLKAEWSWEMVARHSGEEKVEVKRGVASMTGTWAIFVSSSGRRCSAAGLLGRCATSYRDELELLDGGLSLSYSVIEGRYTGEANYKSLGIRGEG